MKKLRSIHRLLALTVGLFVLFQGFTGAVSQQRFWLLAASEPKVYAVGEVTQQTLSPADIIATVKKAKPDFRPAHVMFPMANSPATAVIVMGGRKPSGMDMSRSVTVDQYSGAVLNERSSSGGWVGTVTGLHKWANFGTSGRVFLTIMGLATTGFMVSGLLMWRRTQGYAHRLTGMSRWHRSAGFVVALILIVVSLTGVALNLVTWQEKNSANSVVASNMLAGMAGEASTSPVIGLESAWERAVEIAGPQRLAAFSDVGPHAAKYWFAFTSSQLQRTDVLVDPISGDVNIFPSGVLTGGDGLRAWLYPLHTGYVFGPVGELLMTIVGAVLGFWAISGLWIWLKT